VLLTSVYINFKTARYKQSYPYMYGIRVIHGNTIIEGYDISNCEIGIIVDAPNVSIRDTNIENCIDGIITTSNANYCTIYGNYISNCVNGITTDSDADSCIVANNYVACYDIAFKIGSSNSRVVDNAAYLLNKTIQS